MYSLSTIIICCFHLDLQRNAQLNTNTNTLQGLPTISLGSFRAASQRVHDTVMAEFGGSLVEESVEAGVSRGEVEPAVAAGMTEDEVELEECQSWPQGAEIMDV